MPRSIIFVAAFVVLSTTAQAAPGECLLQVNGKTYINGYCDIEMDKDGSFTVNVGEHVRNQTYFAYLYRNDDGTADASWNKDPRSTHAQSPLGSMTRTGACWISDFAKLCAWKPGTRKK